MPGLVRRLCSWSRCWAGCPGSGVSSRPARRGGVSASTANPGWRSRCWWGTRSGTWSASRPRHAQSRGAPGRARPDGPGLRGERRVARRLRPVPGVAGVRPTHQPQRLHGARVGDRCDRKRAGPLSGVCGDLRSDRCRSGSADAGRARYLLRQLGRASAIEYPLECGSAVGGFRDGTVSAQRGPALAPSCSAWVMPAVHPSRAGTQ
jgi:hypothetical protein